MKFTLDISMDPHLLHTNLDSIPKDCSELFAVGSFLKQQMFQGKMCMVGDTQLSTYSLNEKLKKLKSLTKLDLSGCTEIVGIRSGFSYISAESIILPPNVAELPTKYYCPNLTTIIGKGLKTIRNLVGCPSLEHIEFNSELEYIRVPNTNIRKISLPNVLDIPYVIRA